MNIELLRLFQGQWPKVVRGAANQHIKIKKKKKKNQTKPLLHGKKTTKHTEKEKFCHTDYSLSP